MLYYLFQQGLIDISKLLFLFHSVFDSAKYSSENIQSIVFSFWICITNKVYVQ